MFLSFIPAWLGCCLLYGASPQQKILSQSLPTVSSRLGAALLIMLSGILLFNAMPLVSGLIAALTLVCCFLPLITLLAAYGRLYLKVATVVISVMSIVFYSLGGAA